MTTPAPSRFPLKRLVAAGVSLALLLALLASVDGDSLASALRAVHPGWLALAMLLFIPQIAAISHRWRLIAAPVGRIGARESARQVLASNALNLLLPSKLGDLAKGVFLHRQGRCRLADGIQIVVFEKLLDLAALSLWMIAGWLLLPVTEWWALGFLALGLAIVAVVGLVYFVPRRESLLERLLPARWGRSGIGARGRGFLAAGPRVMALVRGRGARSVVLAGWSLLIWLLHLLQIACFFAAARTGAGLGDVLVLMPMAIFAGLMPLSIAGVGVRDWAIVVLFAGVGAPREALVAAGLLVSLRYVVPAAAGLPFVARYFGLAREARESQPNPRRPRARKSPGAPS
jgi:uncharacterized protein (TIRG00374 family)